MTDAHDKLLSPAMKKAAENPSVRNLSELGVAEADDQLHRKLAHLLKLAVKREREAEVSAKDQEKLAAYAIKQAEKNAKWAQDSIGKVKDLTQAMRDQKQWAEQAEKRAAVALALAATNEEWARKSDTQLLAANLRITELEKYLNEHREWALRCEAELSAIRNQTKLSAP